ncbi:MAG: hypothetical protein IT288_11415 [Bdellovibrionales bacterium]|nr:hypothetical protein [Bdellovibrionales bacterium]
MKGFIANFLILPLLFLLLAGGTASALDRKEALTQALSLKSENTRRLGEVDTKIRTLLNSQRLQEFKDSGTAPVASRVYKALEEEMEVLILQRRERLLRQEFLDRLVFQIDSKFQGGDIREFLHQVFLEMSLTEASSGASDTSLWRFLTYLSLAIKTLPERGENLISFVEGYMEFSTISKPVRPDQFVSLRHYTNGTHSQPAEQAVDKTEVGDAVESRLEQYERQTVLDQAAKRFEERKPLLKVPAIKDESGAAPSSDIDSSPPEEEPAVELRYRLGKEYQLLPQTDPAAAPTPPPAQ